MHKLVKTLSYGSDSVLFDKTGIFKIILTKFNNVLNHIAYRSIWRASQVNFRRRYNQSHLCIITTKTTATKAWSY